MLRLVDSQPEIDAESTGGKIVEEAIGHLELKNIYFRYREWKDGLRTLSESSDQMILCFGF